MGSTNTAAPTCVATYSNKFIFSSNKVKYIKQSSLWLKLEHDVGR